MLEKAKIGVSGLKTVIGSNYTIGQSARVFDVLGGIAGDWVRAKAKVKYVYGIEMSPGEDVNDPDESFEFYLPEDRYKNIT